MSESLATKWSLNRLCQQIEEKKSIINGISDALMLLDVHSYEILDVNQAFLNLYRVSRGQVIGKTCHEIIHHLPQPCSQISNLDPCTLEEGVSIGGSSQGEHVHMDRDGNDLYIEIRRHLDPTILHRARRMLSEAVSVKMEGKQRCQKRS